MNNFTICLLVFTMHVFLLAGTAQGQPIAFEAYHPDSLAGRAAVTGRPVLLYVTSDGCVACYQMEHHTFKDPALVTFLADSALVFKLDLSKKGVHPYPYADRRVWFSALDMVAVPWLVFYGKDGREVERLAGGPQQPRLVLEKISAAARRQ